MVSGRGFGVDGLRFLVCGWLGGMDFLLALMEGRAGFGLVWVSLVDGDGMCMSMGCSDGQRWAGFGIWVC